MPAKGTKTAAAVVPTMNDGTIMQQGRWSAEEHEMFVKSYEVHGRQWKMLAQVIKSRTVLQIRTHAQKYFNKLSRNAHKAKGTGGAASKFAGIATGKARAKPATSRRSKAQSSRAAARAAAAEANNTQGTTSSTTPTPAATTASSTPVVVMGAGKHKKTHSLSSSTGLFVTVDFEDLGDELSPSHSGLGHSATRAPFGTGGAWEPAAALEEVPGRHVASKPRKRKDSDDGNPAALGSRKRGSFHDEASFVEQELHHSGAGQAGQAGQRERGGAAHLSLHATTPWEPGDHHRFDEVGAREAEEPFQFLSNDTEDDQRQVGGATTPPTGAGVGGRDGVVESKGEDSNNPFSTPPRKLKFPTAAAAGAGAGVGGLDMGSPMGAIELSEFIFPPHGAGDFVRANNHLHSWMQFEYPAGEDSFGSNGKHRGGSAQLDIHQLAKLAEVSGQDESVFATSVWT